MPDPRKKIQLLANALEELRLHVGRKDLAIGMQKVNAMLYFSLANACLRGRCVLLYGGIGANKTTLVNLIASSFLSIDLDEAEDLMVTGHPEQTEENSALRRIMIPRRFLREMPASRASLRLQPLGKSAPISRR